MKKQNFITVPSLLIGILFVLATNCKNDGVIDVVKQIPILSTAEVTNIGQITAQSGGTITSDAGFAVTARGVCWNTNGKPTIKDNKTTEGLGAEGYTSKLTGLIVGTTYYLRAYATNSEGTAYGSTMIFETLGSSFTDSRDGNIYKIVTIGDQIWMAENLAYIPNSGNFWANENIETYGYLYDWQTALNVCPSGWHLPSDDEWTELTDYLGGTHVAGGELKAIGTIEDGTGLWHSPNSSATNETGFTALPGGFCGSNGDLGNIGDGGYWWSATEANENGAWHRNLYYNLTSVTNEDFGKNEGLSVRCVRD
jgi:uncharacterized protein (TIGR02145 family)